MKQTGKRWLYPKVRGGATIDQFLERVHDDLADHLLELEERLASTISTSISEEAEVVTGPQGNPGADGEDLTLPVYKGVTSAQSPINVEDNTFLVCVMTGDIDVYLPSDGEQYITLHRDGAQYTLTVYAYTGQTVSDASFINIVGNQTTIVLRKINNDWKIT